MANFLVTGGSGFIGSNLVKKLLSLGHWVYYTGKASGENNVGAHFLGTDFHKIDFAKLPPLDAVFHQAAITDTLVTNRKKMFEVNVYQSMALFEAAIRAECKTIVYASSCAVYGSVPIPFFEYGPFCPLNVYADSKLALDLLAPSLLTKDVTITGLRYSNVYGLGEGHKGHASSMIYQIIRKVRAGERPKLFETGHQARDWVYIDDVVDQNLAAAKARFSGVFNGGSGELWSFNDIFKIVKAELKSDLSIDYIKNTINDAYQDFTMCDMGKSEVHLGHIPKVKPPEGVQKYIELLDQG